jgi:hypothetical protein
MVEKVLELNREKTIFWGLVATLFLAIAFYMSFINTTIHNTVARQNLEAEVASLTLSIGSKEFTYISKRNNVTLALAHSLGYKDAKVSTYVSKANKGEVAYLSR